MIKLKIVGKDNYVYQLEDERERKYELNLEFLGIENIPKVGDYIHISVELVNPEYAGYSTVYTFGSLDSQYGKEFKTIKDMDLIKLEMGDLEVYLKRLYG